MSKMRDPFDDEDPQDVSTEQQPIDLSSFTPQKAAIPRTTAIREIEAISESNGFAASRPTSRRRRGPVRHPWTIRAPIELRHEIEALGEALDLRDDDVIRLILNHYRQTTPT